jgi:hypothetical protein
LGRLYNKKAVSIDNAMSVDSLVEGEAVLYSNLVYLRITGLSWESIDWNSYYDEMLGRTLELVAGSGSPLILARNLMAYAVGGAYVTDTWIYGRNAAVDRLWNRTSYRMLDWMNGWDYVDPGGIVEPSVPEPDPPEGFEAIFVDQLGAVGLFSFIFGLAEESEQAWEESFNWRFDQMWTFADLEKDRHAAIWLFHLIDDTSAAGLADLATDSELSTNWKVSVTGEQVIIMATGDLEVLPTWEYPDPGRMPRFLTAESRFSPMPRIELPH